MASIIRVTGIPIMQYIANSYNVPIITPFKKGKYSSFGSSSFKDIKLSIEALRNDDNGAAISIEIGIRYNFFINTSALNITISYRVVQIVLHLIHSTNLIRFLNYPAPIVPLGKGLLQLL
jgi:hypothetical protein